MPDLTSAMVRRAGNKDRLGFEDGLEQDEIGTFSDLQTTDLMCDACALSWR